MREERKRRGIILKWCNFDAQISALFERTRVAYVLGASRSVTYAKTKIKTCKMRDAAPWPLLGAGRLHVTYTALSFKLIYLNLRKKALNC